MNVLFFSFRSSFSSILSMKTTISTIHDLTTTVTLLGTDLGLLVFLGGTVWCRRFLTLSITVSRFTIDFITLSLITFEIHNLIWGLVTSDISLNPPVAMSTESDWQDFGHRVHDYGLRFYFAILPLTLS